MLITTTKEYVKQMVCIMLLIALQCTHIVLHKGYRLNERMNYMPTSNINVRVDRELKLAAEALFNDLGLNMSSAITMFLKSAVSHDGIPFEIKRIPNAETRAALAEFEEMQKNPENYKRYPSFDAMLEEVLADA